MSAFLKLQTSLLPGSGWLPKTDGQAQSCIMELLTHSCPRLLLARLIYMGSETLWVFRLGPCTQATVASCALGRRVGASYTPTPGLVLTWMVAWVSVAPEDKARRRCPWLPSGAASWVSVLPNQHLENPPLLWDSGPTPCHTYWGTVSKDQAGAVLQPLVKSSCCALGSHLPSTSLQQDPALWLLNSQNSINSQPPPSKHEAPHMWNSFFLL